MAYRVRKRANLSQEFLKQELLEPSPNESDGRNLIGKNPLFLNRDKLYQLDPPASPLKAISCLLYTSPSPRDQRGSRMPSSA